MGALSANPGGGGPVDIFGGGAGNQQAKTGMSSEDLIQMIRTTVAPEQWEIPGQSMALHGKSRLLVTGSPEVHLLVRQFLAAQSRAFQTLVHIESRWLDISDNYYEEIGVDWSNLGGFINDPLLNTNAGYVSASNTRSYAAKLINDLPGTAANISPALVDCGFKFQLSILSDKHLSAIFKATEQHNQRHVVQSEEVTTISGQRALVANAKQMAYISGYDIVGQAGRGTNFDPTVGTVNAGTVISILPYVSADKKRITMELKPQYVDATFFKDEIRNPTTFTIGTDDDGRDITFSLFQANPIELPNIRSFVAATSVSVPDGGSLLFGGFSRNLEQHSAARIPFLGTVPFLGRLFGKRGSYSERTIGSLLVTARIVLLEEEETFQ
jgi:general secretion pathway protein D